MQSVNDRRKFIEIVCEALELDASPDEMLSMTLGQLDLDSLDLAVLIESLRAEYGDFTIEATDGLIDPDWTVAELHHFVAATVDRSHGDYS